MSTLAAVSGSVLLSPSLHAPFASLFLRLRRQKATIRLSLSVCRCCSVVLCPSPSLWLSLTIRWPGGVDVSGEAFVLAPLDCNLATLKEKKKCISVCLSLSLILSGNKQVPRGLVLVCFCTSWIDRKDTDFKWEFYFLANSRSSVMLFVSIFIY